MDPGTGQLPRVALIASAFVAPAGLTLDKAPSTLDTLCDVTPKLRDRKQHKFMAKQDQMAVIATADAAAAAGLGAAELDERTGIYFCVGLIPFAAQPLQTLYENSVSDGRFSMQRFSDEAYHLLNPLLTFKCLPNMPVFHISQQLQIRGRYFVTYPGLSQWFQALQQAVSDLQQKRIDYALVGAVADQCNPLVQAYVQRVAPDKLNRLIDAAAVLLIARAPHRSAKAYLTDIKIAYQALAPVHSRPFPKQHSLPVIAGAAEPALHIALNLNPALSASLPLALSYQVMDGFNVSLCLQAV